MNLPLRGIVSDRWWVGSARTATGTVASKAFKAAETRNQGRNRQITTQPSCEFEVNVDGLGEPVHASLNSSAGEPIRVGQRVTVRSERRGVAPLWTTVYVLEMTPAERIRAWRA
jgi:hypothetical protein